MVKLMTQKMVTPDESKVEDVSNSTGANVEQGIPLLAAAELL
jgi:hypothetical protein